MKIWLSINLIIMVVGFFILWTNSRYNYNQEGIEQAAVVLAVSFVSFTFWFFANLLFKLKDLE